MQDQAIGRSRGGLGTKSRTMADALGNPALGHSVGFFLAGGQAYGLAGAGRLLPGMKADMLIADKAFDADKRVIEPLAQAGKTSAVPSKASRKAARDHDKGLCQARRLVEHFSARLKQFRAVATRYDKTAQNFLGGTHLAASLVWLNCRHALARHQHINAGFL